MGTPGRSVALGLIVNANARGVKRRYARRSFWRDSLPGELVRLTRDLDELDAAVADFRERGVGAVAALGGDGTAHHLIEAVLRRYEGDEPPALLPLAGGTLNGVARALGAGRRPEQVLPAALAALSTGELPLESRRVLQVEDHRVGRIRYGVSLAAGLVYRVHQRYYRHPDPGLAQAVLASTLPVRAALFGGTFYQGVELEVLADGEAWLREAPHTVLASIVPDPLLWFRPFGSALECDEAFHFGALSMRPRELVPRLWSVFRGTCRHPRLRVGEAREATVKGGTGYIIDGDLYPGGEGDAELDVKISLGPRLRFLVPA